MSIMKQGRPWNKEIGKNSWEKRTLKNTPTMIMQNFKKKQWFVIEKSDIFM